MQSVRGVVFRGVPPTGSQNRIEFHKSQQSPRTNTTDVYCPLRLWAMMSSFLLIIFVLLGVCDVQGASDFRVCAFNLQHFGDAKAKKSNVMQTLVRIISRCDVCLLQEVRDSRGKAMPQLLDRLSRFDTKHRYETVASQRLGRSDTYQEQYVFVYRADTVTVAAQYQYPDDRPGDIDAFSREPFVVRFRAPKTAIKEFVLIPQHTSPSNTTKELDALYDVLQQVKTMWKTENVMLLGDFNADCGYLAKKNRKNVRLLTDSSLLWLISDNTDTTVRSTTSCTYDRIVVHGERFASKIVPNSAKPFNFQTEYGLTEEQALEVSDHYPVEVLLRADASRSFFSDGNSGSGTANKVISHFGLLALFLLSHILSAW